MDNENENQVMTRENAIAELNRITKYFGFNISMEVVEQKMTVEMNNMPVHIQQERVDADVFITKIMSGKIKFDDDINKLVLTLNEPITTDTGTTSEICFGKVTMATVKSIKWTNDKNKTQSVQLKEINFGTMDDKRADAVLMAMSGISDHEIFSNLEITDMLDLKFIGAYYFN
jgi:hypothetical protein